MSLSCASGELFSPVGAAAGSRDICARCGKVAWQHSTSSTVDNLPPIEAYHRFELELPTGTQCAIGIEDRDGDVVACITEQVKAWGDKAALEPDVRAFAQLLGSFITVNYPRRYWFVEVWSSGPYFYQIIQRPKVGFRQ